MRANRITFLQVQIMLTTISMAGTTLAQSLCIEQTPADPVCSILPEHFEEPVCPEGYEWTCGLCNREAGCYREGYIQCIQDNCCLQPFCTVCDCPPPCMVPPTQEPSICACQLSLPSCWVVAVLTDTCLDSVAGQWVYTFSICVEDCPAELDIDWYVCPFGTSVQTQILFESDETLCIAAEGPGSLTVAPMPIDTPSCSEYSVEAQVEVPAFTCVGDIVPDGVIDVFDQLELLNSWGPCPDDTPCDGGCCPADLDGNGAVDVFDLLQLLASWGPCP